MYKPYLPLPPMVSVVAGYIPADRCTWPYWICHTGISPQL